MLLRTEALLCDAAVAFVVIDVSDECFVGMKHLSGAGVLTSSHGAKGRFWTWCLVVLCALQAGEFDAVLSLADTGVAKSLLWRLGSINVTHAATNSPLRSMSQLSMSPRPEIHHIFQQPGRRPPVAVSLTFTALSVAPLGFLLIHLAKLKVNIKVSANPSWHEACSLLHTV